MQPQQKLIIIFIIIVLVVAPGAYYFGFQRGAKRGYDEGAKATKAAYDELIKKAETGAINPIENLPSTNPFEGVRVNPFEGLYKNPFK